MLNHFLHEHKNSFFVGGGIKTLVLHKTQSSLMGYFTYRKEPCGTHSVVGWVGHRAGVNLEEKKKSLLPAGNRTPNHPAHCLDTILSEIPCLLYITKRNHDSLKF